VVVERAPKVGDHPRDRVVGDGNPAPSLGDEVAPGRDIAAAPQQAPKDVERLRLQLHGLAAPGEAAGPHAQLEVGEPVGGRVFPGDHPHRSPEGPQ